LGNFEKAVKRIAPQTKKPLCARTPFNSPKAFESEKYWESRYASGGSSGVGSYGKFAAFKAAVINSYVAENSIESIIEYGCGDGNQLTLANYPQYLGFDVSESAIDLCKRLFARDSSKRFKTITEYCGEEAQLTMSLDVIYHLTADDIYEGYMQRLFDSSTEHVIIYSSNTNDQLESPQPAHIRHRRFSDWIQRNQPQWSLIECLQNAHPYEGNYLHGSFSDFYFYRRNRQKI
jgi:hypothetical protein